MTPLESAALRLADVVREWETWCKGSAAEILRQEHVLMAALADFDAAKCASPQPGLERAALSAAGTVAAMLRKGYDVQPTSPTGIALVEAVDALVAGRPAPGLDEVERAYLEACYSFDVDVQAGRECGPTNEAIMATFKALHAARTRSAPDALEEARIRLDRLAEHMDLFVSDGAAITVDLLESFANDVGDIQVQLAKALAERTPRG